MDHGRWEHIQSLFHDVVDLPPPEQQHRLDAACGADAELRAAVLRMIGADAEGGSPFEADVAGVADALLGDGDADRIPAGAFGPYRIVRRLPGGGMGVVYEACRDDLGQAVAIKVLHDAWVSSDRRDRFAQEQRTLAQLSHRSIPRLYDADVLAGGTPWFAMEFIEGVSLTRYCVTHALTMAARLGLLREVCEAVQHAHEQLVVHRDLKPDNILVTASGAVKLLDFGIAKQLRSVDADEAPTHTLVRHMTLTYAAPEQITGGRISVRTDVYSLGVILYELLTGGPPFDIGGVGPREAEAMILEQEPRRPSLVARASAGAPKASTADWADLEVICLTAMHKDPQRRYQTVDALIGDVDRYCNRQPIYARRVSLGYRAGKFVRRNTRPLAAATIAVVTLAAVVTFYTVRLAGARNEALAETARTQEVQRFMMNLFDAGEGEEAPSSELRVLTLLERGVRDAEQLEGQPDIQAELRYTLASLFQKLGSYDRAEGLFRASLDRRRELFGSDHAAVLDTMIAIGLLKEEDAKLDEAEPMLRDALAISQRALPRGDPITAKATAAVGKLLEERGAYTEAISLFEEALKLYSIRGSRPEEQAAVVAALANTHFYAGNLDASESLNREMLAEDRRRYGERHPNVAHVLINIGTIHSSRGDYAAAAGMFREALQIFQGWYAGGHPETASAMTILAQALTSLQQFDEASALLRQALAIQERVYDPTHPRIALALNALGNVALQQGSLAEAETAFTRALGIYRSMYPAGHFRVAVVLSNLGNLHVAQGQHVRAEKLLREAIDMLSAAQSPTHVNTAIAQTRLGRALARQGQLAEAERYLLQGDEILSAQAPAHPALRNAREDLVRIYLALNQPEKADTYR
jgi:tetratricopeptide (TPR) repeat protein/tRNA A-37 threonylcarbamoyl transferase component Bud32